MDVATYWNFADRIRLTNRYVLDEPCRRFVQKLCDQAKSRVVTLEPEEIYYRAQVNSPLKYLVKVSPHDDPVSAPLPPDRMIPSAQYTDDGRINPRGIAYLYLADSETTAIAEVRPLKDEVVTIGLFSVGAPCEVIDCRLRDDRDPDWSAINTAMRFPAGREDTWRIYLPTQCIAEHLRSEGYKGLLYGSAMHTNGHNIALFDVSTAQHNFSRLVRVREVQYTIERDTIFEEDIPSSHPLKYVDHDNLDLD